MNTHKREEQRQRREQKQRAAATRLKTLRLLGRVALFGVAPVLVLVLLYNLLSQGPAYSAVELVEGDHIRGDRNNPVAIVVYADFQCPACARENETTLRLWPQIRDKAYLVFRHYPLTATHRHAWTAALYAEAAARQNRFWEMHDILLANQPIWAAMNDAEQEFDSYALELDLDLQRLHEDMALSEVVRKVRNDQRSGNASGVRSTPAMFVNGRLLPGIDAARILQEVNTAYASATDA